MPSFLNAAYQVLKDSDHPMSQREITERALSRGLLVTQGATPEQTMGAMLYMDIIKKGSASRFLKLGPNNFALNDHQISLPLLIPKVVFEKTHTRKRNTVDSSSSLAHEALDQEILSIQAFLSGKSEQPPTSEKICDWISLCYRLRLYTEGTQLFIYVDAAEVNDWYYERTKKMARLCNLHKDN